MENDGTQKMKKSREQKLNELVPELSHMSQLLSSISGGNSAGSMLSQTKMNELVRTIEDEDISQQELHSVLLGGELKSQLVEMPEQDISQVEDNLATLHRKTGVDGESMLRQLQRRASDYQKMQVQEALSLNILDDPRALQAFSEEVPLTATSMGLAQETDYAKVRQQYPEIVNHRNNPLEGLLQCDCCLSQRSYPEDKNQLVYCQVCLSAVHVKCHQRRLTYAYSDDMIDFICERCRFLIDNNPPAEDLKLLKCAFCQDQTGILIYVDRHSKSVNKENKTKAIFIGWAHLACIFWNYWLEFVDERRLEVRQDARITQQKNKCKYCKLDSVAYPTTVCASRSQGRCGRSFHVRCAIKRGLITDYETMAEHHWEEALGRPLAHCAKHTVEKRFLQAATGDCPSMDSNLVRSQLSTGQKAGQQQMPIDTDFVNAVEQDTFVQLDQPNQDQQSVIVDLDADVAFGGQQQLNPGSMSSDNTASWCSNNDNITTQQVTGKRKRGRPSTNFEQRFALEMQQQSEQSQDSTLERMRNMVGSQQELGPGYGGCGGRRGRPRGRGRGAATGSSQGSLGSGGSQWSGTRERLQMEIDQNVDANKRLDRQIMCIQNNAVTSSDRDKYKSVHPTAHQFSFQDRLKRVAIRQDEKSGSALENEAMLNSELSQLQQSMLNQTQGMTSLSQLQQFYDSKQVDKSRMITNSSRPDLNTEFWMQERMNRGERIMYDLRPELAELLCIRSPADRVTIQKAFVNFCIEHDIVDLHCHQYNIGRHPRMRELLGVETMQSIDLFKVLRGLILPFSVEEREMERRRIIEFQKQRHLQALAPGLRSQEVLSGSRQSPTTSQQYLQKQSLQQQQKQIAITID